MVFVTSKVPRLDLHGEITAMVEALVNSYIKEHYLAGDNLVCIIHGRSTNILTKEVHKVLSKNKLVKKYYFNGFNVGETVCELIEKR